MVESYWRNGAVLTDERIEFLLNAYTSHFSTTWRM